MPVVLLGATEDLQILLKGFDWFFRWLYQFEGDMPC